MTRTRIWRGPDEIRRNAGELAAALAATGAQVSAQWPAVEVWLHHHDREQPWAVLIDDPRLTDDPSGYRAVAVLSRRRRHGVGQVHSATEAGTPAAVRARDAEAGDRLAEAIVGELAGSRRPWTMSLGLLPEHDVAAEALRHRLRHAQSVAGPVVPRLIFEPDSDLRRHLSRNTRSAVARARNRLLDAAGAPVDFRWLSARAQADAVLTEVIDLHRRRNRQLREYALLDDPAAAAYFEDMVTTHAEAGRLQLLTARVNGDLAAFAVCFRGGATSWVYANLVAPEWTDFSVGTMTNAEVVRRFHAEPTTACLDWGAGTQRYKLSGGAQVCRTQMLQAWSSWPGWSRAQIRRLHPAWATT